MPHVVELCLTGAQHLGEVAELALDLLLVPEHAKCPEQGPQGSAVIVLDEFQGRLGGLQQGLGMRQARMLGVDLIPLVRQRCQLFELVNLPLQPLALLVHVLLRR